jgi:hypothetical protein
MHEMEKTLREQKAEQERRSSGRAQPVDWVWTLPTAVAKAPQIINAAIELGTMGSAALDIPATVGGTEYSGMTVGNILRSYGAQKALWETPNLLKRVKNAKTSDEELSALRDVIHTTVSISPLFKWNNALYRNFATPTTFADNLRKFSSNEELDPVAAPVNLLRTIGSLSGKKEGGEYWEEEIDDKRRRELEAQGYIIEDLD